MTQCPSAIEQRPLQQFKGPAQGAKATPQEPPQPSGSPHSLPAQSTSQEAAVQVPFWQAQVLASQVVQEAPLAVCRCVQSPFALQTSSVHSLPSSGQVQVFSQVPP